MASTLALVGSWVRTVDLHLSPLSHPPGWISNYKQDPTAVVQQGGLHGTGSVHCGSGTPGQVSTTCVVSLHFEFMINNNTSRAICKSYNSVCTCLELVQKKKKKKYFIVLWDIMKMKEFHKSFNLIPFHFMGSCSSSSFILSLSIWRSLRILWLLRRTTGTRRWSSWFRLWSRGTRTLLRCPLSPGLSMWWTALPSTHLFCQWVISDNLITKFLSNK